MSDRINMILDEYDLKAGIYELYAQETAGLLSRLLAGAHVRCHSIRHRLKGRSDLRDKIIRKSGQYTSLIDVTDIAGVRVICYFADDVDAAAQLIEREFDVDGAHTTDKRQFTHPDRFGYKSMHHVVRLNADRLKLAEYRDFDGLPVEIQSRSLLQHAWAEIEHDLGYKQPSAVPDLIRRRFSRIASLLELADEEFDGIRNTVTLSRQHAQPAESLGIEGKSLAIFIATDPLVREVDDAIANVRGSTVNAAMDGTSTIVERLRLADVRALTEIKQMLETRKARIVGLAREIFRLPRFASVPTFFAPGISLLYVAYLSAVERFSDDRLSEFLSKANIEMSVNELHELHDLAKSERE